MPYRLDGIGYRPADTSDRAAAEIAPKAPTLRERVRRALLAHPAGLTADEIAAHLGEDILSIRPRVTELRNTGTAIDTGRRRENARGKRQIVWAAAQRQASFMDLDPEVDTATS